MLHTQLPADRLAARMPQSGHACVSIFWLLLAPAISRIAAQLLRINRNPSLCPAPRFLQRSLEAPQLAELFSQVLLQLEGQPPPGSTAPIRRVLDVPYHQLTLLVHPNGYKGRPSCPEDCEDWDKRATPDLLRCQPELGLPYLVGSCTRRLTAAAVGGSRVLVPGDQASMSAECGHQSDVHTDPFFTYRAADCRRCWATPSCAPCRTGSRRRSTRWWWRPWRTWWLYAGRAWGCHKRCSTRSARTRRACRLWGPQVRSWGSSATRCLYVV
jgi:hypothetical protein